MSLNESQKHNVEYLVERLGVLLLGGNSKKTDGFEKFKSSFDSDELT